MSTATKGQFPRERELGAQPVAQVGPKALKRAGLPVPQLCHRNFITDVYRLRQHPLRSLEAATLEAQGEKLIENACHTVPEGQRQHGSQPLSVILGQGHRHKEAPFRACSPLQGGLGRIGDRPV